MLLLCVVSAGTPTPPIAVPPVANDTWVDAGWGTWVVDAETGLTGPYYEVTGGTLFNPVPTAAVCKQLCIERTGCMAIAFQVDVFGDAFGTCMMFFSSVATCMSADGLNRVECWGMSRGQGGLSPPNVFSTQVGHVDAYKPVVYAGNKSCVPGPPYSQNANNCTFPLWDEAYPWYRFFCSILVRASPSSEDMSPQKRVRHDMDAMRGDVDAHATALARMQDDNDALRSALATALARITSLESAIGVEA